MNKFSLAVITAFAVAFIGCTHNMGHFNMISTEENVDWSRKNEFMISNESITGNHYIRTIVFVVTGAHRPELEVAAKEALSKVPGAVALVDVDFKVSGVYAVFYSHTKYTVTGKVLIDPTRINQQRQYQYQYQYQPQQ